MAAAKEWVEKHFPAVQGSQKVMLILAYGAGIDAGLAEAQEFIDAKIKELIALSNAQNDA